MADNSMPGHLQLSPEVRDLIHRLLQKNPADRIKLDRIVEHPWLRLQECPPSATAQDSGMFTMTTTNFSSNSNISRPGPRPLAAFPVLTEYSEESPGSQQVAGLTASRPPTPQLASLRHQLASLPSVASQASCRDTVREVSMVSAASGLTRQVSTPCLQPRDSAQASLRSNYSDPALRPASVSAHQMSQHSHAPSPRPPSPTLDNIDNYQVGDLLGRGGFASVYKATCINTGMEVAIKMVDKQQMFRYEKEIILAFWRQWHGSDIKCFN